MQCFLKQQRKSQLPQQLFRNHRVQHHQCYIQFWGIVEQIWSIRICETWTYEIRRCRMLFSVFVHACSFYLFHISTFLSYTRIWSDGRAGCCILNWAVKADNRQTPPRVEQKNYTGRRCYIQKSGAYQSSGCMSGIQFNGFTLAIDQIKSLALWSKLWSKPNEVIPQTKKSNDF